MSTTLADQLVEVLRQAGVTRVYGVVGDSLNPLVDSIRRADGIEWVAVRNEEAGAFAAASEAKLTEAAQPGRALASRQAVDPARQPVRRRRDRPPRLRRLFEAMHEADLLLMLASRWG
jgi:hypothetical protein